MDPKEDNKEGDPPAPAEDSSMKAEEDSGATYVKGEVAEGETVDNNGVKENTEGVADKPTEDAKPKEEDEGDADKEGDMPTKEAMEVKPEPPPESEVDPNAAYHQQMHSYGYHPGMQHHPPPHYYGGYYAPPPPHYPHYPPPPGMEQEPGSSGAMGSPGPEGMHHYYPPPPPPYGYPPQHHYAPYPPASPVKSPSSNREYPSQHQSYFPAMTPPRYNHEHDRGEGKKDDDMKAPDPSVGPMPGGAPESDNKASNLKVYVKPKGLNVPPEVMERRARKNANSRARAAKHRLRVVSIESRPQSEWTEEERKIIEVHYKRRNQKNDRSRERALEKKAEIDRILSKPEGERAKLETQFLENALGARSRKNEGDRVRRRKLKELGVAHIGRNHKQYTSVSSPSKGGGYPPPPNQQQQYSGYPPPPYGYGGYPPPPPPPYGMMGPPASPYRGYPSPMGGGDPNHPGYPPPPEGGDPYANPPPPPVMPHLIPGEGGGPPPPGDRPPPPE